MGLFNSLFNNDGDKTKNNNIEESVDISEKQKEKTEFLYLSHINDKDWVFTEEANNEFKNMTNVVARADFISKYLKSKFIKRGIKQDLICRIAFVIADGMYMSGYSKYTTLKGLLDPETNPIINVIENENIEQMSTNEIINSLLQALHGKKTNFSWDDLSQIDETNIESMLSTYIIEREIIWFIGNKNDENFSLGPYNLFEQKANNDSNVSIVDKSKNESETKEETLYEKVVNFLIEKQIASTSIIQREFGLGYNAAARLIDELEENGIIGPPNGSKPRKVLIK